MLDDLRMALKGLATVPGFALMAVATLALGIGANTLIFSLVHGVLLKPLPFRSPERLVAVPSVRRTEAGDLPGGASVRAMDEWRETSKTLERPAIYRSAEYTVAGHGDPERADACLVSEGFFDTLGTRPFAGRVLDGRDSDAPVAVLSYELWSRRFGASDPVGRTLRLDGRPYTIVGVMPRGFAFPSATAALWIPRLSVAGEARFPGVRRYEMVARLRESATLDTARSEAAVISTRLESSDADFSKGVRASVERLEDSIVGNARRGLLVLFAGVVAILLVACVKVGSLVLAREASRQGEMAIRSALGASRGRLVRALVAESLLLVAAGAAAAWVLAGSLLPAAVAIVAPDTPRLADVAMDLPVLAFTLAASVLTIVLAGALPAWRMSRVPIRGVLSCQSGQRGPGRTWRLRAALAGVQAAVSVLVIVGAVLFGRTLGVLLGVEADRGGDAVVTMRVTLPEPACEGDPGGAECQRLVTFAREALARVGRLSGVQEAALTTSLPPKTAEMSFTLPVRNRETGALERYKYQIVVVDGDFFGALGIQRVRGRLFDARDTAGGETVFVVSRDFARRQFGSEDVVGRQLPFGPPDAKGMPTPATLVGVVDDVRYAGLDRPPGGAMYFSYSQKPYATFHLMARTTGSAAALAERLRATVRQIDPEVPMAQPRTLAQLRRASVADPASRAIILGSLAALALLLVGVGLYANGSDMTTQRTVEIGVRMALGADGWATVRMLVVSGLAPVGIGLAVGLAAAVALSRITASLLFGVRPTDPVTYVAATVLIVTVAAIAIAGPARRAVRIDPAAALNRQLG
jgi:putative ABC transport system permease protein